MSRRPADRRRAGFSLIELLIAMTMLLAITGAAWSLFRSQSRAFATNTERYDLIQNARGALEGAERVIRTMGAGSPSGQPMLVYGNGSVLAFNSDYIEQDTVDMRWAAYLNEDTPVDETLAWTQSAATTIPTSSPSYTYPTATYRLGNGTLSPAETYIFYFQLDASTSRTDDYMLYQRINDGDPEIVARNILAHPSGAPFFEYLFHRSLSTGDTMFIAPTSMLPFIRRTPTTSTSSADSTLYIQPDSVRAVRMNLRLTNGKTGTSERFRDVTTTIEVPNNGIPLPTICGRAPLEPPALSASEPSPGDGRVTVQWTRSDDQDGAEQDVLQYILWRRPAASTTWAEPVMVIRAESGTTTFTVTLNDNSPSTAYTFGIAAQDCTPSQSTIRTVNFTTSATP